MATYLLTYHGGEMPESDDERAAATAAWDEWFASLGPAVVVTGDPVGMIRTIRPDGSVTDEAGPDPVGGYSVIAAGDIAQALEIASGCPLLDAGGTIRVGETFAMS